MTYETYNQVLQALANGHPCNTTSDFSVSVHHYTWKGVARYSLYVFPSEHYPWFTTSSMLILWGISKVFNVQLCMESKHGTVIASLS